LKPSEKLLLAACRTGKVAMIGDGTRPATATDKNSVRAGFLRFLLLGGDDDAPVHEQGVRLKGAWITEHLAIEDTATVSGIDLKSCYFEQVLNLQGCSVAGSLFLQGSRVPGISGNRAVIRGGIFLSENFESEGAIWFVGSKIGGNLACDSARIGITDNTDKISIIVSQAKIDGAVRFCGGFHAEGRVALVGTQIRGDLVCHKGTFHNIHGYAIEADRAMIKGGVSFRDKFNATGTVSLDGAHIGGNLDCGGGNFSSAKVASLSAKNAIIKRDILLNNGFRSDGEVNLLAVRVLGSIVCSGGGFNSAYGGRALNADRCVIKGRVLLRNKFRAIGEVRFVGASIGADLDCDNAHFEIDCNNTDFEQGKKFSFNGKGMRVFGKFIFKTNNAVADASLESMTVGILDDTKDSWGNNLILDGFVYGSIAGGSFKEAKDRLKWLDKQPQSMSCTPPPKTDIRDHFVLWSQRKTTRLAEIFRAWIHFLAAPKNPTLDIGRDFRPQPWRQLQKVLRDMGHNEDARQVAIKYEDRLRYANLVGTPPRNWWLPIAWIYRKAIQWLHFCFGRLTGYGYRPFQLLLWFGFTWIISSAFYWWMALPPNNVFAPSNPLIFQNPEYASCLPPKKEGSYKPTANGISPAPSDGDATTHRPDDSKTIATVGAKYSDGSPENYGPRPKQLAQKPAIRSTTGNWYLCKLLRKEYSGFSPPAYSLDVMLPLVDLQQEKHWAPMIRTPKENWRAELISFDAEHTTRLIVWIQTLFGWITSLLLVAIVSGLTKRRED